MKTKFTLLSKFNLQTVFTVILIAATCTFLLGQIVKKVPRIISNTNTDNTTKLAGPSCEGLWSITTVRTYDPVSNTTTYTFSVTKTGARNALSHWGFPITLCPDQPGTVQQILAGHKAESSLNQVTWSPVSTSYGKDPSTNPQCTNGDVLKFEQSMGNETTRYYRLFLNGNWSLIPETAYVKYGNNCCTLNMNTPGCLEEGCLPPPCTISGNNNVCPSSTNTYSGSAGNDTYSWTITSGTATIIGSSTSPTVQVQAGSTCGFFNLRLTTTKGDCQSICSETYTIADANSPSFTGSYGDVILACVADAPGSLGTATATDACGAVTITSSDGSIISNGCNRSITRTFTARDACNNTATISRTVRWISILSGPVLFVGGQSITGTTTFDLGCNPLDATINTTLGEATATNTCGSVSVTALDGPITSDGCNRARVRTFSATDGCGNIATAARIVRWIISNIGGPQINPSSAPTVLGCNPSENDINAALGTVTATDACANVTITSSDGPTQSDGCGRSRTRTFTATGGCGNTATASRTVTWTSDNTAPSFTGSYTDVNLGCNPANPGGSLGTAIATDACGTPTVTSSDGTVQSNGCSRSQKRTWTARDACGNTATASRTVIWTTDITPPVFTTTPASVDVDCTAPVPSLVTPTASDACGTTTVTMTGTTDNPANCTTGFNRIVTRTWTARDACGNTATYTQTIRVKCCENVCTLTQGAYGNPGGNICLPNGTTVNQTQIMIDALTAAPGNMVVFGRQDMNRYWVIRLSDVNQGSNSNIFEMLPGGGQSAVFGLDNVAGVPEFDNKPSWPIAPLVTIGQQAGKISNQLFSQTLTLYFNTTIAGSTLSNVSLNGLAVIAPRNCGSSTPAGTGTPTQLVSPTISSYLSTHGYAVTVGGLLQLANDALGGVNVSPLTLSQIQEAVGNINETFDECKILTGYVAAGSGSGRVITSNSIASQPSLIVTAFPNPYKENFSLKINSPVTGQAIISFYNMSGVKVSEMKRDVVAFQDLSVPYAVPEGHRTRIVYTVNVGSYNARGIVLSPN